MSVVRRVMDVVPVDTKDRESQYEPITLKVRDPGKVRMVTTVLKESGSVIQIAGGQERPPEMVPIPAIVFEIDPDGEERRRHYLWLAPGVKLTYPGNLEFRGTYIDEITRDPMFLYEAFPEKKG